MAPHPDESGRRLSSPEREEPWGAGEARWAVDAANEEEGPAGTVLTRTEDGRTVVELRGEIDLAVVLDTTPQLFALTTAPAPHLVADLRPVTFIDCSGLALLVDIRSRVLASGGTFTLVCVDPRVLRLLQITGLSDVLVPVPSPDGAAGGGRAGSPAP
ncbi:STAS domain-containing protein [Streptomyces oryzae]|uniref:Anti-sigma factor antagonist n=1 Tax=Streptomyces oryzae TaxID=1434886 RepID=A0ABS3XDA0_9ACTN|nr:STAS domain-containing protein [Streptomyces oryzae]MBO8193254.1 STAS domain-containing protein [Streptomyces oryzae]